MKSNDCTLELNTIATLSVADVAGLIIDKFAEDTYTMKEFVTGRDVIEKALSSTEHFHGLELFPTKKHAYYFIAFNSNEAADTFDYLRKRYKSLCDESSENEIRTDFCNPYYEPILFAREMVEYGIYKAVHNYLMHTGESVSVDNEIDVIDLASKCNTFADCKDIITAESTNVTVPSPETLCVDFDESVVEAYPVVAIILASAPDGSFFDDIIYNNQKNPNFSIFFSQRSLLSSIWTCLTQDAPMIGFVIDQCIKDGRTDFDMYLRNPIKDMRKIESAHIVDRVMIALSCDCFMIVFEVFLKSGSSRTSCGGASSTGTEVGSCFFRP